VFTEDFLDIVVNVQWSGGLYALIWVYAGPTAYQYAPDGPATLKRAGGASVPFNPTVNPRMKGVSTLYRRVFINTDFPVEHFTCDYPPAGVAVLSDTIIGTVPGSDAVTLHTIQITDPASYLLFTEPISLPDNGTNFHGAPFPGGCSGTIVEPANGTTGVNRFSGFYRDGPDIPAPGTSYPLHQVTQVQTYTFFEADNVKADFEAVFLLKLPAQKDPSTDVAFTIHTGQYIANVAVMIYPQQGISFDPSNKKGNGLFFGRARGGRVFVPLKWSTGKPPNGPDGQPWPGYRTIYPGTTPLKLVDNANLWVFEIFVSFEDAGRVPPQTFNIVMTYDNHLTSRPDAADVMAKDQIVEAYPAPSSTTPGDGAGYGFYVDNYTDVPYGIVYDGNSFPSNLDPGPWALIDADVPL
jgi:hypothetical protein